MKNLYSLSLMAVSLLIIGCGSSNTSSSTDQFSINNTQTTFNVIDNMKKDIQIKTSEDVTLNVIDDGGAVIEFDGDALVYRAVGNNAIGTTESVVVEATSTESGEKDTVTLSFTKVSADTEVSEPVLQTGANDGAFGTARTFTVSEDGDVTDAYGNVWAGETTDTKLKTAMSYLSAYNKCDILRVRFADSNWRLPTKSEVLNLIDYSKTSGDSMLDDAFNDFNLTYTWVQPNSNNQNEIVALSYGISTTVEKIDVQQQYTAMCINAPLNTNDKVISTDRFNNITYDLTTGLMWSPIDETQYKIVDDLNTTAAEYCAAYDNASGWRVPNLNELRSLVEDSSVSIYIRKNATVMVSATPYNNTDSTANAANYAMYIVEDGTINFGPEYVDNNFSITCVKESE